MGAQLILSPSAWAVVPEHDEEHDPYGERLAAVVHGARTPLRRDRHRRLQRRDDDGRPVGRSPVHWQVARGRRGRDVLGLGPYGVDAEALVIVDVELRPPMATGTDVADGPSRPRLRRALILAVEISVCRNGVRPADRASDLTRIVLRARRDTQGVDCASVRECHPRFTSGPSSGSPAIRE